MGISYYRENSEYYWRRVGEFYGYYLDKYLCDNGLSLLYMAHKDYTSSVDLLECKYECFHIDTCEGVVEFEQSINKLCFTFDYDLIIMDFHRFESLATINSESNYIKKIALSIAKIKNKRVSIGFFSYLNPNRYIFYSVAPNEWFVEEKGDMTDAPIKTTGYIGKMLFIHNKYKKMDKPNFVKSIGCL